MNDTHSQDALEPRGSEAGNHVPTSDSGSGIVSVNSRGATSNEMAGKRVFLV
jgi:hypothetical protein